MARISDNILKLLICALNIVILLSAVLLIIAGSLAINEVVKNRMKGGDITSGVIFIISGSILVFIVGLGCWGSISDSFPLLLAYSIALLVVAILELVGIVMAALLTSGVKANLRQIMDEAMTNYNMDSNNKEFWDSVQCRHKCCGIESYEDWSMKGLPIPETCCYEKPKNKSEVAHTLCKVFNDNKYLYQKSCYQPLRKSLLTALNFALYSGAVTCCIKVIGVVLGFWLAFKIRKFF